MNGDKMENIALFFGKYIDLEPIPISDLLTFASSIVLLIITWKSVVNASKSNEITSASLKVSEKTLNAQENTLKLQENTLKLQEDTLKLQAEQFYEDIKPIFIMDFPYVITEGVRNFEFYQNLFPPNTKRLNGDYTYIFRNVSNNIAYNVKVNLYLYADEESWMEYKGSFNRRLPLLSRSRSAYHLNTDEEIENTIPNHYFKKEMQKHYSDIYILISYKNKIGDIYEEGYLLTKTGQGNENIHGLSFNQHKIDISELKQKLLSQKSFLEKEFEDDLFYYLVPE